MFYCFKEYCSSIDTKDIEIPRYLFVNLSPRNRINKQKRKQKEIIEILVYFLLGNLLFFYEKIKYEDKKSN